VSCRFGHKGSLRKIAHPVTSACHVTREGGSSSNSSTPSRATRPAIQSGARSSTTRSHLSGSDISGQASIRRPHHAAMSISLSGREPPTALLPWRNAKRVAAPSQGSDNRCPRRLVKIRVSRHSFMIPAVERHARSTARDGCQGTMPPVTYGTGVGGVVRLLGAPTCGNAAIRPVNSVLSWRVTRDVRTWIRSPCVPCLAV
jgi:hypothetical protein